VDISGALSSYIEYSNKIRDLKAELKTVQAEMSPYEKTIMDHFELNGIQNIKQTGVTVYIKKQLWAGKEEGISGEEAAESLKEAGLGEYIGPSTMGLSAYLRELDKEGAGLPAQLIGKIKLTEKFTISARRS